MVILSCLTGVKLNWLKSYDTKCKNFHFHFLQFYQKDPIVIDAILGFFAFCVITFDPIEI